MGNKPVTTIAAIIFLIMAVVHAYRLATQFQITVGNHTIPMWVSWAGLIIPLLLAWGLWREARR
ncbi:MAG TPA: hypothetical protein VNS53_08320 [Sphingomicrobium sp.]|jgi:hypothetical protein|nr:hypothetical protein [Sphingomicrobium sp.]